MCTGRSPNVHTVVSLRVRGQYCKGVAVFLLGHGLLAGQCHDDREPPWSGCWRPEPIWSSLISESSASVATVKPRGTARGDNWIKSGQFHVMRKFALLVSPHGVPRFHLLWAILLQVIDRKSHSISPSA